MLTFKDVEGIVAEVQCEPYRLHLSSIEAVRDDRPVAEEDVWYLQAHLYRQDTDTNEMGWGHGGKYFITPHMAIGEIVKKCFVACRDYAEHEVREAFQWKGRAILGPHIDIFALWNVAETTEHRDTELDSSVEPEIDGPPVRSRIIEAKADERDPLLTGWAIQDERL